MKRLGITQRVALVKDYGERRDCLDQRWSAFTWELGYLPVPLPNIKPELVPQLFAALQLDAVILSGGNTIASLDPDAANVAPERDAFESAVIAQVLERNMSILGVCRGMQMLNLHMGGRLEASRGHVAVRHPISTLRSGYELPSMVNSYHDWGIPADGLADALVAVAQDDEGHIEAFELEGKNVFGVMWHPEREQPFNNLDIQLIKKILP